MSPRVWIKELTINDGTKISFESNDIVLVVGPNNSGKSTILKEIIHASNDKLRKERLRILTDLVIEKDGSIVDVMEHLESQSFRSEIRSGQRNWSGYQWSVHESTAALRWREINGLGLGDLQRVFMKLILADGRLGIANQIPSIDLLNEAPTHTIHFLFKSDDLEIKFSDAFARAFQVDLVVNRGAGSTIHLHVGKRPVIEKGEDRVSTSYLEKLRLLPTIQEQGDGMRSFVGLLLEVLFGQETVNLIDEPEVFLHPPQARLLGRMIAEEVPQNKQIFISTHSEDFLKGVLDSNSERVKVLRIQRIETKNSLKELSKDQVKGVWNDPLLRHSNVFSGLFHTSVVLCEGDMDCRFYSSILNALIDLDQQNKKAERFFKSIPDPLFIHCGGKERIPVIVRSLRAVDVTVFAICDFDILNAKEPLKSIFCDLGGDWNNIEMHWKIVKSHVESKKPELETTVVKDRIEAILKTENERIFSNKSAESIRELLRKTSAWSLAKENGKTFIPSGDATVAYEKLIGALNKKGVYVVEVGEVEKFDKTIGGHGPKWVNQVMNKDLKTAKELTAAREFVKSMFQGT